MKRIGSIIKWCVADIIAVATVILLSGLIINNFALTETKRFLVGFGAVNAAIVALIFIVGCVAIKLYSVMWRFAGLGSFIKLECICVFNTIASAVIIEFTTAPATVSFWVVYFLLLSVIICGMRMSVRYYIYLTEMKSSGGEAVTAIKQEKIMVIGAGQAASILINDAKKNIAFSNWNVVCAVDDDDNLVGKYIGGVKIMGTRHDIVSLSKRMDIDTIIFAIPSMPENQRAEILKICSETGCKLKSMPSVDDMVNSPDKPYSLKKVEIEDLLERVPIKIDLDKLMSYVNGKTILVTGGGGSIGSELCRQIAANNPSRLVIFDVYENNAYDIQNELKKEHPALDLVTLIGSVRDSKRMECVFETYKPEIVYHAAAHKHVPLMEDSPNEAIKNNVFGTFKTAMCADKYGVERFVLISTDKAVNPTNVMGASKRICEMIVQMMSRHSKTEFVAVRFGNVLGSNGSVIPLFRKQIEQGGPVLVTHPDIIRYFMTIPEAVSLVLTAGAMAKGGEIFVLDMGKPVKILDLAKNMIRLMGYRVDKDINIEFTGLRPGEKLYEELLMDEEGLRETDNHLIHIGNPLVFDDEWFKSKLEELKIVMYDDGADVRELIQEIVPTYRLPKKD